MTYRDLTRWKSWFYGALLPALGRLRPEQADRVLRGLGRATSLWPGRRAAWRRAIEEAGATLDARWGDPDAVCRELAANRLRFAARDYLVADFDDAAFHERFEVVGFEPVRALLDRGQGVILLGCHLGGYLAAMHWLYRRDVPLRLLVQRPRHVSAAMRRWFDADGDPYPQRSYFLRVAMPPSEATPRILQARDALRAGQAIYLNGDIPWPSCNARTGRLLGRTHEFLSIWADLAALTGTPVVPLFCTHGPGGRFTLGFDSAWTIAPGEEADAVQGYLRRLEEVIAANPADAIPHLTWPAYRSAPRPEAADAHRNRARIRHDRPAIEPANAAPARIARRVVHPADACTRPGA